MSRPISIPPAPLSTPIASWHENGSIKTSDPWQKWLIPVGQFASAAHSVGTATAENGEQLTHVRNGALLSYSYTGKGGVSFDVNGHTIAIPATAEAQTTNSHIIVGG